MSSRGQKDGRLNSKKHTHLDCGSVSLLSFNSSSDTSVSRISGLDLFPYLRHTSRQDRKLEFQRLFISMHRFMLKPDVRPWDTDVTRSRWSHFSFWASDDKLYIWQLVSPRLNACRGIQIPDIQREAQNCNVTKLAGNDGLSLRRNVNTSIKINVKPVETSPQ